MNKPFLIAECGINHNGDIHIAKQLIDLAKQLGWNAVKFQKRTIKTVYTKEFLDMPRESPWGTTQREQKLGLEFGIDEYEWIDKYCRKIDIDWFASAWDYESQKFLEQYDIKYNKIASAMLTHTSLLKRAAGTGKLTFISTGMSTWGNVNDAVKIFIDVDCPFILMHSVSIYPCPLDELNLEMITTLQKYPGCETVGYSGHSSGAMDAIIAAALGAEYIEKHITLDRSMYGSDQASSIEPGGMEFISKHCRHIPVMLGDGKRKITDKEKQVAKKLRYWE